ncbi:MAG: hypothetical protein GY828_07660 [Candidatus Gracilibacteria bacterium]|nr:hypothetical protein [Candidatus Gracilibacteria bacterium]
MTLEKLQEENQILKRKLAIAQAWMEKEVRSQVDIISLEHKQGRPTDISGTYKEVSEADISRQITDFIGEVLLLNIPGNFMENIISAEVQYHSLEENNNFDGVGIILSYHKALDELIESFITKGFRKFAHKKGQTILRKNDVLEKTLHSVVNQGYILGIGRLFHLLSLMKQEGELYDYGLCFQEYLEKYKDVGEILFQKNFYENLSVLVNSEILGKKRHVGNINFEETKQARNLLIGHFENKECLIYKLIETQRIEY